MTGHNATCPDSIVEEYKTAGLKRLAKRHSADITTVRRWLTDRGARIRGMGEHATAWSRSLAHQQAKSRAGRSVVAPIGWR
jgi:hypothetical protein